MLDNSAWASDRDPLTATLDQWISLSVYEPACLSPASLTDCDSRYCCIDDDDRAVLLIWSVEAEPVFFPAPPSTGSRSLSIFPSSPACSPAALFLFFAIRLCPAPAVFPSTAPLLSMPAAAVLSHRMERWLEGMVGRVMKGEDRVRVFGSDPALIMFQVLNHTLDCNHRLHGLWEHPGGCVRWIGRVTNLIHVNPFYFSFFFFLRTLFFCIGPFKWSSTLTLLYFSLFTIKPI